MSARLAILRAPNRPMPVLPAVALVTVALLTIAGAGCNTSTQTPTPSDGAPADEAAAAAVDPLPSWNAGATRNAIIDFVARVSGEGSPDFVPEKERVATFDNDGTLWAEQPMYFQLAFAIDRVSEMAGDHPEWQNTEPFRSLLSGDVQGAVAQGMPAIIQIIGATHGNVTTEEFAAEVSDWLSTARHPTTGRAYTAMVYQPMLELLDYLRANGFKTFIVSGGGLEFMRVFTEEAYGIPPEQVVGSSIETEFQMQDGTPVLMRQPDIDFIDDGPGKPVGINKFIGRRPIAAFGNSDGDLQMLQWTCAGDGARLCVYVHHTDSDREWAYDRGSPIGGLDRGLDAASTNGWTVIDMANDWSVIYPR